MGRDASKLVPNCFTICMVYCVKSYTVTWRLLGAVTGTLTFCPVGTVPPHIFPSPDMPHKLNSLHNSMVYKVATC